MSTPASSIAVRTGTIEEAGDRILVEADSAVALASSLSVVTSGAPPVDGALLEAIGSWGRQLAILAVVTGSFAAALGATAAGYEATEASIARAMRP